MRYRKGSRTLIMHSARFTMYKLMSPDFVTSLVG